MKHLGLAWLVGIVSSCGFLAQPAFGGAFLANCAYTHTLPDDPIVHPGQPGASHQHDFIGANFVDAFSTVVSMQHGGTGCKLLGDTAGYWTPTLYRNGVVIHPGGISPTGVKARMRIYYNRSNLADGTLTEVIPTDLRMVAGNAHATSPFENLVREIYWGCSDNSTSGKSLLPPKTCPTGLMTVHVGFPNCWDGILTHTDDTSHLRYPSSGKCPSGFPHVLPRIIFRWEYATGVDVGLITLSSGPPWTMHGDFLNAWDSQTLSDLTSRCVNGATSCGVL